MLCFNVCSGPLCSGGKYSTAACTVDSRTLFVSREPCPDATEHGHAEGGRLCLSPFLERIYADGKKGHASPSSISADKVTRYRGSLWRDRLVYVRGPGNARPCSDISSSDFRYFSHSQNHNCWHDWCSRSSCARPIVQMCKTGRRCLRELAS